jgi:hypothetical protein
MKSITAFEATGLDPIPSPWLPPLPKPSGLKLILIWGILKMDQMSLMLVTKLVAREEQVVPNAAIFLWMMFLSTGSM